MLSTHILAKLLSLLCDWLQGVLSNCSEHQGVKALSKF